MSNLFNYLYDDNPNNNTICLLCRKYYGRIVIESEYWFDNCDNPTIIEYVEYYDNLLDGVSYTKNYITHTDTIEIYKKDVLIKKYIYYLYNDTLEIVIGDEIITCDTKDGSLKSITYNDEEIKYRFREKSLVIDRYNKTFIIPY